jgi:hypothetical protein
MEIKQLRLKRKDVNTILVPYVLPKINRKKYIQKSIGYTTPCVAILHHVLRSDFKENIKKVTSFLSIQVDLKQSSDDIRDWEEDLRAGILTPVTQGILSVWQKFPHNGEVLNLEKDRQILKSIFENKVLISESKRIINNTRKAEGILRILQKENLFTDDSFLRNYLVTIKSVAQKILNDHALTQPITEDIYPDYTPRPRHIPPHPG